MFITMGVGAAILLLIWIFFKQLLITSFDELLAKAMGMPVNFYHYLLMVLLTLVSVTAMQSVGTILIVAMLITPAATAYLYANSLKSMIFLSSTFELLLQFWDSLLAIVLMLRQVLVSCLQLLVSFSLASLSLPNNDI